MLRSPLKVLGLVAGISIYALAAQPAAAATITFIGNGTAGGEPLSASAAFTTSAGQVAVTISNLLSPTDIRSVGQTVSDLSFTLSNAPGTLGTRSASGQLANIGAGGSVSTVGGSPVRWVGLGPPPPGGQGTFSINGNTILLEAIGGGQPSQLLLPSIIAGSSFSNANSSITGGQFNPFVVGSLLVTIALSGVTADTTITGATFSFGTGPDTFISGSVVPLPGALPLFMTGLAGLGLLGWHRKKKAAALAA
jgi:hypothetical protein